MNSEYILANAAMSRARILEAVSTARACGDNDYIRENRPLLDLLDKEIERMKKEFPLEVVQLARELTNAPI